MPDTKGKPVTEAVHEHDDEFYQANAEQLGDTVQVAEHLSGLYDFFLHSFAAQAIEESVDYANVLIFLASSQYQLVIATLAAMRGHIPDAFQATRRAIENCAFGKKAMDHPEIMTLWHESYQSEQAYTRYRRAFQGLFPKDDQNLSQLGERFDYASKQVHSTLQSMINRLQIHESEEGISIDFAYYQGGPAGDDEGEPIRTLLWTWNTHLLIIDVFAQALHLLIEPNKAVWALKRNTAEAVLMFHTRKWHSTAFPNGQ